MYVETLYAAVTVSVARPTLDVVMDGGGRRLVNFRRIPCGLSGNVSLPSGNEHCPVPEECSRMSRPLRTHGSRGSGKGSGRGVINFR